MNDEDTYDESKEDSYRGLSSSWFRLLLVSSNSSGPTGPNTRLCMRPSSFVVL